MASFTRHFARRISRHAVPAMRAAAVPRGAAFLAGAAAMTGGVAFCAGNESKEPASLNTNRAKQAGHTAKFPPPKLEVPGVLPMHIAGHCDSVSLEMGKKSIPLEVALFIDPMPTNVGQMNRKAGIPEELIVLLKPTEPYDRCLLLQVKEDTAAEDLVELLANQVDKYALRSDRLKRVFDPEVMPKTPPADALKDMKKALRRAAKRNPGDVIPKQSQLAFVWRKEGFLDVRLNDRRAALILSPELSWAIFDSFFGPYSISPNARKEIVADLRNASSQSE